MKSSVLTAQFYESLYHCMYTSVIVVIEGPSSNISQVKTKGKKVSNMNKH